MDYLTIALIMFAIGVVFLGAEVLLPTGGYLVVGALLFFTLGVGIILARGTTTEAVVALTGLAIGLPASGFVAVSAWRRMSIGGALSAEGTAASPVFIPQLGELEALKNRTGKTVSPMRPSGTVEFDGKRVDAMTEGVMLDAGVWVRCVESKGGKVIVREMEPSKDVSGIAFDDEPLAPDLGFSAAPPTAASPPPPRVTPDDLDDLDLDLGFRKP